MNKLGYFIQMQGADWRVKIGQTQDVPKRLGQLRSNSPFPIKLLAIVLDGPGLERAAKKDARLVRITGEWYSATPQLIEFMRGLAEAKRFVEKVETDAAFIEAHIKPLVLAYLAGRRPNSNKQGDLAFRVIHGGLPDSAPRAAELKEATKGAIIEELAHGYLPVETPLAWPRLETEDALILTEPLATSTHPEASAA